MSVLILISVRCRSFILLLRFFVWLCCRQASDRAVRQVLATPQVTTPVSRKPLFQIQIVPLPTSSSSSGERQLITDCGECTLSNTLQFDSSRCVHVKLPLSLVRGQELTMLDFLTNNYQSSNDYVISDTNLWQVIIIVIVTVHIPVRLCKIYSCRDSKCVHIALLFS